MIFLTDETDVAEMALRMNAQFYFDYLGYQEVKKIAYNGFLEPYAVTRMEWDGLIGGS